MSSTETFRRARDFLVQHRAGLRDRVPRVPLAGARPLQLGARLVRHHRRRQPADRAPHRRGVRRRDVRLSYAELAERSNRVATYFRRHGVERGDRILMMLPNCVQIWEVMLAAMKLGACVIPATSLLTPEDLRDRIERGRVGTSSPTPPAPRSSAASRAASRATSSGELVPGWLPFETAYEESSLLHPARRDARLRSGAALLHERHDREAEARRPHARELPGRPPLDDVLDRPAARATCT